MSEERKLPYLKKIGRRGSIDVWLVDGTFVRTNIDEDFSNYGHHGSFDFIPAREWWLDEEAKPDERDFYLRHLAVETRLMRQGKSYEDAREAADRMESGLRAAAGDVKKLTKGGRLPDPADAHVRLWKKLEIPLSVWIVDGRLVRSVFDIDFTEGGHDYVYEYIPMDELWIDNDMGDDERPYVLLHELHERKLMARGWDYDRAHEDASRIEKYCRRHPNELHQTLSDEGWE